MIKRIITKYAKAMLLFFILCFPFSAAQVLEAQGTEDGTSMEGPAILDIKKEKPEKIEKVKLGDIVVTATKYEKSTFDTPLPLTVIGKEEIERVSPANIGDLLKAVAGVEIHHDSTPGISKARIRGLSANRVLVLLDGKRWNSHVSSLTGGVYLNEIDVNQIERIEVLHGPGTVLYGSGAMGGVVNIITKKAQKRKDDYFDTNLSTKYAGVNDLRSGRVELEFGAEGFNSLVGATVKEAGDVKTPEGTLDHSGYKDTCLDLHTEYRINDLQSIEVRANIFRGEIETPLTVMEGVEEEMFGMTLVTDVETIFDISHADRETYILNYEIRTPFSWLDSLDFSAHIQKERMEYINTTSIFPHIMPGNIDIVLHGKLETDTYSAQTRGLSTLDLIRPQVLTIGIEYYRDEAKAPSEMNTDVSIMGFDIPLTVLEYGIELAGLLGVDLPPQFSELYSKGDLVDGSFNNTAFYVQDEIEVFDGLWINIGGRYDHYRTRDNLTKEESEDNSITGGIGLLFSLSDGIKLTGSFSKGFRAPSLEERFYVGAVPGGAQLRGNPEVKSEESINYEAGIKILYSDFSAGITGFVNTLDDYILMVPTDQPAVLTFDNIGEVEIRGIESTLDFRILPNWSAFSTISYARGEDKIQKDPLEGMPPLKTILGIRYETKDINPLDGRLWAELCSRIYARQDRIPDDWTERQKTPAFEVYSFRMGIECPSFMDYHNVSLRFAIDNFTNKTYRSFPKILMYRVWDDSLIQPGRNFVFSLNLKM
ncbi:MAG: TonB-dependent receptor [Thermodesulfobacteriota bacterium]|nr:TonB-dependent receptor [Thermodesulfobacteriota bacterium]